MNKNSIRFVTMPKLDSVDNIFTSTGSIENFLSRYINIVFKMEPMIEENQISTDFLAGFLSAVKLIQSDFIKQIDKARADLEISQIEVGNVNDISKDNKK